jgi:hypothetical protein
LNCVEADEGKREQNKDDDKEKGQYNTYDDGKRNDAPAKKTAVATMG